MINLLKCEKYINSSQRLIIESVKKFCINELAPRVREAWRKETIDKNLFKEFGEMGILGPTIKGYGCLGDSFKTYGLIAKEIESIDSGYRSMFSVQSSLVMNPINNYGSEYLKSKYLPELARGNYIGCFGLTEPNFGSDPASMNTKAVKDTNNYILTGNKMWISNSPIADVFIVWAKYEDNISGFVLDRSMERIYTNKIEGKMSLRSSITGNIVMDDVKVPLENKLNITGLRGPYSCLNNARLGISFGVLGAAETCLNNTIDYTQNRIIFNEYLSEKQLTQEKLANMAIDWNLAFLSCLHVSDLIDEDDYEPHMISIIKRNSCEKALNIARMCRDLLGGNGIMEEYDIFRHMCNLETVKTYEGTHDVHGLIVGNKLTGKKAF